MSPESQGRSFSEHREVTLLDIESKIAQLKTFETDLNNKEVTRSIEAMHLLIDPRLQFFEERNIVITYHGSLQYKDPVNLDVDLDFMGIDLKYSDIRTVVSELEAEFTYPNVWPRQPCDTNFGWYSIGEIDEGLAELTEGGFDMDGPYDERATDESDIDSYPQHDSALILSCAILYEAQRPKIDAMKKEVWERIIKYRWLREGVLQSLDEVIAIREARRISQI